MEQADQGILPFFSNKHVLSNHYPCAFSIDGQSYTSTEQYLFHQKALKVGDNGAAKLVLMTENAADAKKVGERIEWNEGIHGHWMKFASDKLYEGNQKKYEHNQELRKYLFDTAPKSLVEANPYDSRWGVGLHHNDPDIYDKTKWKGKNVFGLLLTKLRNRMMESTDYADEVVEIRKRQEAIREKRRRSDGSTESGELVEEGAKARRTDDSAPGT